MSRQISKSNVWPVVKRAFPNYRGRKFRVEVTEHVSFQDVNWGGGTKNYYVALLLNGDNVASLPDRPPWSNPAEGATVALPPGSVVMCNTIFCGKDLGIRIYVNPADVATLFPHLPRQA
jgi:hypothetical protein